MVVISMHIYMWKGLVSMRSVTVFLVILMFVILLLLNQVVLFADFDIPDGSVVIDFEEEYKNSFGILTFPEGVDFFDVWVSSSADTLENEYIPRSGSHLLRSSGRFGMYAYFDQEVTQEVFRVGGFFSGIAVNMTAYDKDGGVIGASKIACCSFATNKRLLIESKSAPIYMVVISGEKSYASISVDDFFFSSNRNRMDCVIDVPLYLQIDPVWKDDRYGGIWWSERSPHRTIGNEGCAVSSSAMVLSSYGKNSQVSVDPSTLNSWLRSQTVGYVGGSVNWFSVAKYAREIMGIDLWYRGRGSGDGKALSSQLCSGEPIILELNGHFVVAKGVFDDSWLINDPLNKSNVLSQYYGNWFKSTRRFSVMEKDSREKVQAAYLIIDSNAEFDFYVVSPNNEVFYSFGDLTSVEIDSPLDGVYRVVSDDLSVNSDNVLYIASANFTDSEVLLKVKPMPVIEFYFDSASEDLIKLLFKHYLPIVIGK